ncbi:MAG: TetR/AcrR family transcriptional regulator [Scytonema sp. PMC 1069.18]|nr:TetR/AcrR family transcriptional regulator [Scytonema sp. PMC 1069.18]MEC4880269.1 TetR/AcrR family transcriptional regulator [Scytonema sp. PMC 1070.18]
MASTPSKKPARERILETAVELFYQRGIQNVGIDEIIARAGVAKMSLYNHFQSKDHLVAEFLRLQDERWQNWFFSAVERYGSTPQERLLGIFDALKEWFNNPDYRGCAFVNATVELVNPTHPGYQVALEHKRAMYQYILELVKAANLTNAETLARQFVLLAEGAIVVAMMEGASTAAEQAREAASVLIKSKVGCNMEM